MCIYTQPQNILLTAQRGSQCLMKRWLWKETRGSGEMMLVKFNTMLFFFFFFKLCVSHTVLVSMLQVLPLKHFCDVSDGISVISKGTLLSDVHLVVILKARLLLVKVTEW